MNPGKCFRQGWCTRSNFGLPGKQPRAIRKEQRREPTPNLHHRLSSTIITEVWVTAGTFPSATRVHFLMGTCPGKQESAEENSSRR